MKVITAVEDVSKAVYPLVFLAGGITDCPWWQDTVISLLEDYPTGTLLNPRRRDFPIEDPNAAKEQIAWEYNALNKATIFSMWFSGSDSVQPICMYELGRHLAIRAFWNDLDSVVIGVSPNYSRKQDVYIQTALVSSNCANRITSDLTAYTNEIKRAIERSS